MTSLFETKAVVPFLKWAGGKRWFAERHRNLVPEHFAGYYEPFLGSGALFFQISPTVGVISDLNSDLIATYKALRDFPSEVAAGLAAHHKNHCKEYYYRVRADKPEGGTDLACWFIYLNRTCWNGLYRVNKKNEFNVPIGTKTSVVLDTDDFESVSNRLMNIELACCDFEDTIDRAGNGDFVFVDPPYTVRHNLNGFLKYNDRIFSWCDQIRLRDAIARATLRGAMVLVTNANHESVRELYEGLGELTAFARSSVLAADASYRSGVEELVVRTWTTAPQQGG